MKPTDYERIEAITKHLNLKANALSKVLNLKSPQIFYDIKAGKCGISKDLAAKIQESFFEFELPWLLTGEGEMLRTEQKTENFSENNSGVSNVTGNGNRIKNEVTTPVAADISVEMLLKEMAEQRKAYIAQLEVKDRLIEKLMDK